MCFTVSLFLQWQAEQDMRDNCFICSRASYDFEHTGEVRIQCSILTSSIFFVTTEYFTICNISCRSIFVVDYIKHECI